EAGTRLPAARGLARGPPGRGPRGGPPRDRGLMGFVLALVVLLPIVLGASRRLWRGGARGWASPPVDLESRERLARLETAVDTIAIEMERVAEGQRFVTRLLAESP